ncbi:unnamed protein product [Protopolystoma xenopodis]|uniref:Uncharacterized protein n=1 Tax=Protopolystoma xenopodis TaxID=117903 RepID=A0A3S5CTM5_9PLAT|nr:unnamed protein product [Protopolystoma xenopodis]
MTLLLRQLQKSRKRRRAASGGVVSNLLCGTTISPSSLPTRSMLSPIVSGVASKTTSTTISPALHIPSHLTSESGLLRASDVPEMISHRRENFIRYLDSIWTGDQCRQQQSQAGLTLMTGSDWHPEAFACKSS